MLGLEVFYRNIWPGPGRLKLKRCSIFLLTIGAIIVVFALRLHLSEEDIKINFTMATVDEFNRRQTFVDVARTHPLGKKVDVIRNASMYPFEYQKETGDYTKIMENHLSPTSFNESHVVATYGLLTVESDVSNAFSETVSALKHKNELREEFNQKTHVYLVPDNWNKVPSIDFKVANSIVVHDGGLQVLNRVPGRQSKHLMLLGHYEQLGKTTINYMLAGRFAYLSNRKIVKPFVADSRFCGLKSGWTGSLRSGTRAFKPLDLYFNISTMNELFRSMSLADMEYLESFKESCSFTKTGQKIAIIYFLYSGDYGKKYLMLHNGELEQIRQLLQSSNGWIDCSFINPRLKIDKRIGTDLEAGNQFCVDPEKIADWETLENMILQNDPCVVFHQWRGVGYQRTHFNLTIKETPENLLQLLKPSDFVITEVMRLLKKIGQNFVGIHIRSERQLLWYSLEKWIKCMNVVYQEAQKKVGSTSLKIFISSDIGRFGSDQILSNLDANQIKTLNAKYIWLVKKLKAITYSELRPRHHIWTDRGLVALIELNILSQANHLITVGAGTFQKWITDTFKARRKIYEDQTWTLTRICYSELKNWQALQKVKRATQYTSTATV